MEQLKSPFAVMIFGEYSLTALLFPFTFSLSRNCLFVKLHRQTAKEFREKFTYKKLYFNDARLHRDIPYSFGGRDGDWHCVMERPTNQFCVSCCSSLRLSFIVCLEDVGDFQTKNEKLRSQKKIVLEKLFLLQTSL
jgi:hypothetical protein